MVRVGIAAVYLVLGTTLISHISFADDAAKCEASKLGTAAKYDACRLKAEAKAVKKGGSPDFSKCDAAYSPKWTQAETKAGGMCPSNGDEAAVQAFINEHTDAVEAALSGGTLPEGVLSCNADLATCNSNLSTCNSNDATCNSSLTTCNGSLTTCNSSLTTCNDNLTPALACGNGMIDAGESCDQGNLNGQTCVTQGFVGGTLKCGNGCTFDTSGCTNTRFVDNGDGTVTDHLTGLQWEKKDNLDSSQNIFDVHDADDYYQLGLTGGSPDGSAYVNFLFGLNNGVSTDGGAMTPITGCFAGHCDWRLPSVVELQGIVDATQGVCGGGSGACIDPVFGPTQANYYWSATSNLSGEGAWLVSFFDGSVTTSAQTLNHYVRAVRGDPLVEPTSQPTPTPADTSTPTATGTATATATPCSGGGVAVGGSCWYLGIAGASCDSTCSANGGLTCDAAATIDYAGSGGTDLNCAVILSELGVNYPYDPPALAAATCSNAASMGCTAYPGLSLSLRCALRTTTCFASTSGWVRACACL
jgi:hypothetical protein